MGDKVGDRCQAGLKGASPEYQIELEWRLESELELESESESESEYICWMNHKRKRPKNRRAGCLLCKPWKVNGYRTERIDGEKFADDRRRRFAAAEIRAAEQDLAVARARRRWRSIRQTDPPSPDCRASGGPW